MTSVVATENLANFAAYAAGGTLVAVIGVQPVLVIIAGFGSACALSMVAAWKAVQSGRALESGLDHTGSARADALAAHAPVWRGSDVVAATESKVLGYMTGRWRRCSGCDTATGVDASPGHQRSSPAVNAGSRAVAESVTFAT
jgi:hypothetical protein